LRCRFFSFPHFIPHFSPPRFPKQGFPPQSPADASPSGAAHRRTHGPAHHEHPCIRWRSRSLRAATGQCNLPMDGCTGLISNSSGVVSGPTTPWSPAPGRRRPGPCMGFSSGGAEKHHVPVENARF